MKNTFKISLKANEKLYVNGAVIRADRKVTVEFLNDVQFLLEQHVLQAEEADTPLKQLYFIVQIMLMQPEGTASARMMFRDTLNRLFDCFEDDKILSALKGVDRMVGEGEVYEALKLIRRLYPREREILDGEEGSAMPLAMAVGE